MGVRCQSGFIQLDKNKDHFVLGFLFLTGPFGFAFCMTVFKEKGEVMGSAYVSS